MVSRFLMVAAAATGAAAATPALAQSSGEAVMFTRGNFRGPGMTFSGPRQKMEPLRVESLQLAPGAAWELCSGRTFTGCKRFSKSDPSVTITIRSARPVAPAISAAATVPEQGERGSGASLRGLASEFFVMPDEGGSRIEVADTAGALPQRATEFCRAHGWRASPYQRVQTVGGRTYLADVLCTEGAR